MKKTILEIYQQYDLPENLQRHMLQVAGIGLIITDNWVESRSIDSQLIINTLLTHDLGNLAKFDLDSELSRKYLPADELPQWKRKQQRFREKYGSSAHQANKKIIEELGLSPAVNQILDRHSFKQLPELLKLKDQLVWETKICLYSDLRLKPAGIDSIQNRISDLQQRYSYRDPKWRDPKTVNQWLELSLTLEQQLNKLTNLDITKISQKQLDSAVMGLTRYKLETEV